MKKKTFTKISRTESSSQAIDISEPLVSSSPLKFYGSQSRTFDFSEQVIEESEEEQGFIPKRRYVNYSDNEADSGMESVSFSSPLSSPREEIAEIILSDPIKPIVITNFDMFKRIAASTVVSAGTGLAMMPIFNYMVKNSKEMGVDVRGNEALFAVSTANTFIVTFISSFSMMYHFIKHRQEGLDENSETSFSLLGKIGAGFSIVLPLGLLWGIELKNQKVSDSSGFDEYMAWATFTSIPLIVNHTIETIRAIEILYASDNREVQLNSIGSKLTVYGLSGLSLVGRAIAYTEAVNLLAEALGVSEQVSLGLGIVAGGVLGASGVGLFEYESLKALFAEQGEPLNAKKVIGGTCAAIEGAWFSLPLLSTGLKATEGWNPLLKGILFTPAVLSGTIFNASKLYDSIAQGYDTVSDAWTNYWTTPTESDLAGETLDYSGA